MPLSRSAWLRLWSETAHAYSEEINYTYYTSTNATTMFTCGTSNSTISSKTLALIDRAKNLSSRPTCTFTSPTILARSNLSETGPPCNSPSPTLTPDLTGALRRIAELEDDAKKSASLLTLAMDRLIKLEEQVSRCPTTPNSLLTLTSSPITPKRRPTCNKGANCKFGHSDEDSNTTSDSEDSLASRRFAPQPPRRSKRRPSLYRPQVMSSSVPYPPSTSSVPCSSVLLPRLVHDIAPTDLQEEHVLASTSASLRADFVGEDEVAAAAVLKTIVQKVVVDEQKQHIAALATKAGDLEAKYKERNQPNMDEDGVLRSPVLPRIGVNFSKVNPFALAKLPKPDLLPVIGCSQDPKTYTRCLEHSHLKCDGGKLATCDTIFEKSEFVFGARAGFVTNLGIIAPPTEPAFGYVYVCGAGNKTKYALYAEAS